MNTFLSQLKWQFILLTRNNIVAISVAVTVIYSLVFYGIKDLGNTDKLLTFIIYDDTAIIALFFIGISVIMEKNQEVLPALFVAPLNPHIYLLSRIISLSIIGWLCGLGMVIFALGFTFNILHFSVGILGICILSCLAGLYLVSYTDEFLMFLLKTIPILLVFVNLPLLNYFGVTDVKLFYLLPVQGSLWLIDASYQPEPPWSQVLFGYVSLLIWIPLLYWWISRIFISKVINA